MVSRFGFSSALRVVGQVLEERGIDLFDLRCSGDVYFFQCGGTVPPYLDLIKFDYSLSRIKILDIKAKAAPGHVFRLVKFESLAEIFRAIGRRLDVQDGQLLRAYTADHGYLNDLITVEYQTRDRRRHTEEFLMAAAGDDAMKMYKERSRRFAH